MKRQIFLIAFVLMFAAEIVALTVFALKTPDFSLEDHEDPPLPLR